MNNNARYDRSTNFLELEVNVPRTIGILRDVYHLEEGVKKKMLEVNDVKLRTKDNTAKSH